MLRVRSLKTEFVTPIRKITAATHVIANSSKIRQDYQINEEKRRLVARLLLENSRWQELCG